jgi:putative membrane protein
VEDLSFSLAGRQPARYTAGVGTRVLIVFSKLAINTLALLVVDAMFETVAFDSTAVMIASAVVLALVNTFLRPIVLLLTLPINVLTLGLFTLIINGLMLLLVSALIPGFHLKGFWTAVGAALLISIVSFLLNWFLSPRCLHIRLDHS